MEEIDRILGGLQKKSEEWSEVSDTPQIRPHTFSAQEYPAQRLLATLLATYCDHWIDFSGATHRDYAGQANRSGSLVGPLCHRVGHHAVRREAWILDELPCGIAEILKQRWHGSLLVVREMG
jgi:hypothetical protein